MDPTPATDQGLIAAIVYVIGRVAEWLLSQFVFRRKK